MAIFAFKAAEKDIELNYHVSESLPRNITGDFHRIKQVLVNLAGQRHQVHRPGEILVLAQPVSHQHPVTGERPGSTISVRDTGIGIPPEKLPQLFAGLHPGGYLHHPQIRRQRTRARHLPQALPAHGWRHLRHQRSRRRLQLLPRDSAARRAGERPSRRRRPRPPRHPPRPDGAHHLLPSHHRGHRPALLLALGHQRRHPAPRARFQPRVAPGRRLLRSPSRRLPAATSRHHPHRR